MRISIKRFFEKNYIKFKFFLVGVLSTFTAYFSFPLIYESIFQRKFFMISYLMSITINVIVSFLGQKYYVFNSKLKIIDELIKFIKGAIFIIVINYIILYIFVDCLKINSYFINFLTVSFLRTEL